LALYILDMFNELKTERLKLRRIREEDAETIFELWCQDSDICKYMTWIPHSNISITKAFIGFCLKGPEFDHHTWLIEEIETNNIVGCFDATKNQHKVDVGYLIAKQYWGKGYMSEALSSFISKAFELNDVYRVSAVCDVENEASKKVMEKVGMTYEGLLKAWLIHPNMDSKPRDCHSLCIIKNV